MKLGRPRLPRLSLLIALLAGLTLALAIGIVWRRAFPASPESIKVWCSTYLPKQADSVTLDWRWSRMDFDCVFVDALHGGREVSRMHAPQKLP